MNDLKKLLAIQKTTGAAISACRAALSSAGDDIEGAIELLTRKAEPALQAFFDDSTWMTGPPLTSGAAKAVEDALGYKLPDSYLALLRQKNGGVPVNTCFPMREATSWADDHISITGIRGIGGKYGIDAASEAERHASWAYPAGLVFAETPTAGHTAVMFDYSRCGATGEPSVVWVDTYADPARLIRLAPDFLSFMQGLEPAESFMQGTFAPDC